MYQRTELKSALAFFFLFFIHETSIGNGQQGISYNVWCMSSGTYTHFQISTNLSVPLLIHLVMCSTVKLVEILK